MGYTAARDGSSSTSDLLPLPRYRRGIKPMRHIAFLLTRKQSANAFKEHPIDQAGF